MTCDELAMHLLWVWAQGYINVAKIFFDFKAKNKGVMCRALYFDLLSVPFFLANKSLDENTGQSSLKNLTQEILLNCLWKRNVLFLSEWPNIFYSLSKDFVRQ